jgi:hypothetical protein
MENFDSTASRRRSNPTIKFATRISCIFGTQSDPTVLPRWVNDYRELNANTVLDSHPLPRVEGHST